MDPAHAGNKVVTTAGVFSVLEKSEQPEAGARTHL